jgi:hypothetical protein
LALALLAPPQAQPLAFEARQAWQLAQWALLQGQQLRCVALLALQLAPSLQWLAWPQAGARWLARAQERSALWLALQAPLKAAQAQLWALSALWLAQLWASVASGAQEQALWGLSVAQAPVPAKRSGAQHRAP